MKRFFKVIARCLIPILTAAFILAGAAFAEDSELVFNFKFDAPEITTDAGITRVSMKQMDTHDTPGEPVLPLKQVEVLVPFGMVVEGIDASGERVLIPGTYNVEWGEFAVPIGEEQTEWAEPDPAIYGTNRDFPGIAAKSLATEKFRGYSILLVHLYPVQYFPTQGKLSYFKEINLKVNFKGTATLAVDALYRGFEKDKAELSRMVLNPGDAATYPLTATPRSSGESPLTSTLENYDHVIITPDAFRTAFQSLADYKNSIGVASTIVTTEEIFANPAYDGVDDAEEVRNFIIDAYQNWGISYALLGGDDYNDSGTQLVPERGCYLSTGSYAAPHAPCDLYFGALDGNWNNDGDAYWGEVNEIDYYPEVHIGRVTVDTVSELNTWLAKDLFYEQNSGHPQLNQALWLGESLDSYTWGSDSKEVIIGVFPPDEYEFTKLYDKWGNYTRQTCINEMNEGPHLINHLGHANSGYVEKIYRSDVDTLVNDHYFFNYSQGCMAGAFDQDYSGNSEGISEHFLFSEGGAFAVIMNARYGWYSPGSTNGASQKYDLEFFDALYTEGIRNLGAANDDSRTDLAGQAQHNAVMRWCYLELNLHGDPHTAIHDAGKPDHDILVYNFSAPNWMEPGPTTISADIKNDGLMDESNILVEFKVDDVLQDTYTIASLISGAQETVSFPWHPTDHPQYFLVSIHAVPVPDEETLTNNTQQKNVVVDYPPVAIAEPESQDTFDHHDCNFNGSGSYDPDDSIIDHRWDFGDGASGYGETVTYQYKSAGDYNVELTVTDNYSATGTDTCSIKVWDRGHDMKVLRMKVRKSVKINKPYTIPVTIKNVGSYVNAVPGPAQSDYALVTLTLTAPDSSTRVYTETAYLLMGETKNVPIAVNFDMKGNWTAHAHVDISDSAGNPNAFPRKDENPGDNDLTKSTIKCR